MPINQVTKMEISDSEQIEIRWAALNGQFILAEQTPDGSTLVWKKTGSLTWLDAGWGLESALLSSGT